MRRTRKQARYTNSGVALGKRDDGEAVADYRDAEGARHRIRLGVPFRDKAAARDALDRFVERRKVLERIEDSPTIGTLWRQWLAERAKDGLRNDIYKANWVPMERAFASVLPENLTPDDCRRYAKTRFATGCSSWTVHTELARLRTCLRWARGMHLIPRMPKVWVPQTGAGRERVLTRAECEQLLAAAREKGTPHVYLFIVLLFSTGARHSAVLDLTWDRVNFEAGTIDYEDELAPDPMHKGWRKGRATVLMTALARRELELACRSRTCAHVITYGGTRLKTCRQGFQKAVEDAGLWDDDDPITPHTIRHTVATMLDAARVDVKRTAQLLGHADQRTTQLIYTHAAPEVLQEAVAVLDQLTGAPAPTAGQKMLAGLGETARYAEASTAITDWIREDAPLAVKMAMTPDLVRRLVDRLCGSKTTMIEGGKK